MFEPFVANLLLFGRVLRRAGVEVHHSRLVDAVPALEWIGIDRREDVRATLGALLVHRQEDIARFHAAFDAFFQPRESSVSDRPRTAPSGRAPGAAQPVRNGSARLRLGEPDGTLEGPATQAVGAYSAASVSRSKDFAEFTAAELDEARRLMMAVDWQLGTRPTRRWERASAGAIDLRPVLRRSVTRGEIIELPRRRQRRAPRPLVLIGDVSGSMERYSRVLLHFVYGLAHTGRQVESFVFATHLTRLTRALAERQSAPALTRLIHHVQDWGGGTRIGEALHTFNTRWARRVMRNGPIVLIVSDGWDRGDPAILARELARVGRTCRRLIWLNPLLGSASYEPLTRGMQAALRYVDDFLPAHNLESLRQLAAHLQDLPTSRRRVARMRSTR